MPIPGYTGRKTPSRYASSICHINPRFILVCYVLQASGVRPRLIHCRVHFSSRFRTPLTLCDDEYDVFNKQATKP